MINRIIFFILLICLGFGACFFLLKQDILVRDHNITIRSNIVSLYNYYEISQKVLSEYLEESILNNVLETSIANTVRVRIYHSNSDNSFKTDHGSGVLVGPQGIVLTAAHVVVNMKNDPLAHGVVILPNGHNTPFNIEEIGPPSQDWAILSLKTHPEKDTPNLEFGTYSSNEEFLILGYPAQAGVDFFGRIKADKVKSHQKLKSLGLIAKITNTDISKIFVTVGLPPIGGMSGGPVINSRGEVIGIVTGWSHSNNNLGEFFAVNISIPQHYINKIKAL